MVVQILLLIINIFQLILLARILLSWFPTLADRSNPVIQFIYDITEPILRPIRDLMPPTAGIDFSPLIVFLIIQVLTRFLLF